MDLCSLLVEFLYPQVVYNNLGNAKRRHHCLERTRKIHEKLAREQTETSSAKQKQCIMKNRVIYGWMILFGFVFGGWIVWDRF